MGKQRINCVKCQHFYITWDKNFGRGCKAHGFKTRHMPALVVRQASGMNCLLYRRKDSEGARKNDGIYC